MSMSRHREALRFSQIRNARRVLDMKGRIAAGIIGMPYDQLRKAERADGVVPHGYLKSAQVLIRLAERGAQGLATERVAGKPRFAAVLPFERPRCLHCRTEIHVVGSAYTLRRGDHWYFKCPTCGRRYWSNDGRANPVKIKGGLGDFRRTV